MTMQLAPFLKHPNRDQNQTHLFHLRSHLDVPVPDLDPDQKSGMQDTRGASLCFSSRIALTNTVFEAVFVTRGLVF